MSSASVVCNTDIVTSLSKHNCEVFANAKTSLDDKTIQNNIKKIRKAIAEDQKVDETDIDLSKFYFVRSMLSSKGHKEEAEHQFQNFLFKQDGDLQVATAKSIFSILYDELDKRFNEEISEECTDIGEIFEKKGMDGKNIKSIISCGLAIQIPTLDKLFADFGVTSVLERRRYNSKYTQIKIDMYSNISLFVELKRTLLSFIEVENLNGVDDMPGLLEAVYKKAKTSEFIPAGYQDEHYLRMLIMILIYKFCCGGENA